MRRRALLAASVAALAAACGIDALGVLEEVAPPPPDAVDATGPEDVTAPPDAEVGDAASDVPIDADAEAGPSCLARSVVVADPFSVLDGGSWISVADLSNAPYPQIATTPDGPGASLVNPAASSSLGALWIPRTLPLHAFDVTFRYVMPCEAGTCSDGLAVAWLEATDAGPGALAGYVVAKASFALPQQLRGSAVAFDLQQDAITGDPVAPYLSLLALDGAVPGQYAWHSKTAARPNTAGTHAVSIRLRNGIVAVSVDGALVQTGAVASRFDGWFGFGASSGDTVGTFVVRAFSGTFYPCDDP